MCLQVFETSPYREPDIFITLLPSLFTSISVHLCLGPPNGLLLSDFPSTALYVFRFSPPPPSRRKWSNITAESRCNVLNPNAILNTQNIQTRMCIFKFWIGVKIVPKCDLVKISKSSETRRPRIYPAQWHSYVETHCMCTLSLCFMKLYQI